MYRYSDSQELVWDDSDANDWDDDMRGISFWKTKNFQSDGCSLGDVLNYGSADYGEKGRIGRQRSSKLHIIVKEVGGGRQIKHPTGKKPNAEKKISNPIFPNYTKLPSEILSD